jgi:NTE family protein
MKPKVHLVLGSGGARGIAHIAVIEELEKAGYEIVEVIGCSMGAVVGGIYAAGKLPEYKEWITNLSRKDVFDLLDFTFTKQGFVKGEKLFAKHVEVTGQFNIEELNIAFTAVATDMKHNEEVHFTSGDLYKALRASVSIPGVFLPVLDEGRIMVDGGVINPLPINLVNKQEGAITIAVNLNGHHKIEAELEPESQPKPELEPQQQSASQPKSSSETDSIKELKAWFQSLLPDSMTDVGATAPDDQAQSDSFSLTELMDKTFNMTQDRLANLMIDVYKPDKLIEISRSTCTMVDFDKAEHILETGRQSYHKAMGNNKD